MNQEQNAYIKEVHLKGYKSIRDVSVSLKRGLNIIIGANGSGKTNFLEFLDAATKENYGYLFNGQNRRFESELISGDSIKKLKGERVFSKDIKGAAFRVEEIIASNTNNYIIVHYLDENKKIIRQDSDGQINFDSHSYSILLLKFENPLNEILRTKLSLNLSVYKGYDSFLEKNDNFNIFYSSIKSSTNSQSFLYDLFHISNKSISSKITIIDVVNNIYSDKLFLINYLQKNLNQFSPIKDIKIDWSLTRKTIQKEDDENETALIEGIDFLFFVNDEWINWTQLSDGTKRLFYLIGSVTYAKENEIILMEEPELGVHPHQLTLLMNFLKAQSEEKQIIISTHSPQVLNCLKEDELDRIIVVRHEGKAGTKMYHLSEEEKGYASDYMKNEAFLSDYWLQSGFMNEEMVESV